MSPEPGEKTAYSIFEVATLLGVSRQRVHQIIKERSLQTTIIAGNRHLLAVDVEALLENRDPDSPRRGRPKSVISLSNLPPAPPDELRRVLAVIEDRILTPIGLDEFRKSHDGRVILTDSAWGLEDYPSALEYLKRAVARDERGNSDSPSVKRRDIEAIYTALHQMHAGTPSREDVSLCFCSNEEVLRSLYKKIKSLYADRDSAPHGDEILSITSPRLDFTPHEQNVVIRSLPDDTLTGCRLDELWQQIRARLVPQYVLENDQIMKLLSRGQGLRLAQSLTIYGRWGSGKTRLGASLALRAAFQLGQQPGKRKREVWFYALEQSSYYVEEMLNQTLEAWYDGNAAIEARVIDGEDDPNSDIIAIRTLRAPHNLQDVCNLITQNIRKTTTPPAAIVIDSLGVINNVERDQLDRLLRILQQREVLVILIAEENEEGATLSPAQMQALNYALWVTDLVLHTRVEQPGGRASMDKGLVTRALEIQKSRRQIFVEGRHYFELSDRIKIFPALATYGVEEYICPSKLRDIIRADTYQPSLVVPDITDEMSELDNVLRNQWRNGGSLALYSGLRTFKDLIGLLACVNAIRQKRSCLLVNMRPDYINTLLAWITEHSEKFPQYTCFKPLIDSAVDGGIKVRPYDPDRIGERPEIQVVSFDPGKATAAQTLWHLYCGIEKSITKKHRCALISWNHFSEMMALAGFRSEPDFMLYALRMLSTMGCASVLNFDEESYQQFLKVEQRADMLPLVDYQLNLKRLDDNVYPDPTVEIQTRAGILHLILRNKKGIGRYLEAVKPQVPEQAIV